MEYDISFTFDAPWHLIGNLIYRLSERDKSPIRQRRAGAPAHGAEGAHLAADVRRNCSLVTPIDRTMRHGIDSHSDI